MKHHETYIKRCIEIAKNGLGFTRPNPMVGSVIVHNNNIIGEGFTSKYGSNHAEVNAINSVVNKELLKELVLQNDIIIPLAAIVGFPACERDKELATQINYEHVKFVCDIAKENNKKVVYPNTNSGYGIGENGECTEDSPLNPISHYGKTKVEAEKEVLGIGGISLRLATVFGTSPRMRMDLLVNEFVYKALTDKYITIFEKDFRSTVYLKHSANIRRLVSFSSLIVSKSIYILILF